MARLPLEGIRVLDLTRAYAGTIGTMYWSDIGAEIIKVEAIQRPDIPTRQMTFADNDPGELPWERAAYFHRLNVGKMDITLELNDPRGQDLFKRLVKVSDVVAENYSPRTMLKFGLHYEALKEVNPSIIMISMSGFGAYGPRKHWTAYANVMESAGLTSITGYEGEEPGGSGVAYGDWVTGSAGALAVLMALHYRHRTGKGQYIDLAGRETLVVQLGEAIMDYTMNGRVQGPQGNKHAFMAPHNCYPCQGEEKWVAIAVEDEEQWQTLCRVMRKPELAQDERFADALSRYRNQAELDQIIAQWTCQHEHREASRLLLEAGVPAGALLNGKEMIYDPHLQARNFFEVVGHPVVGKRIFPRQLPAHYSDAPYAPRRPAPLLGENNREVLMGLLGLSEQEMEKLEADEIIGTKPTRVTRTRLAGFPLEQMKKEGGEIDGDYLEQLGRLFGKKLGPGT